MIHPEKSVKIRGIFQEIVRTIGVIESNIKLADGRVLEQEFHVVAENVPLEHDGILGRDFLIKNKVRIDFGVNGIEIPSAGGNSLIISMNNLGKTNATEFEMVNNGLELEKMKETEKYVESRTIELLEELENCEKQEEKEYLKFLNDIDLPM